MGKFTWGNLESLSESRTGLSDDRMHERLHEFWRRYYRAPYMTLAVQADQPLDTLQQWVSVGRGGAVTGRVLERGLSETLFCCHES